MAILAMAAGWAACQSSPASDAGAGDGRILDVTLRVDAPFSTASLNILGNGSISYSGERRGQAAVQDSSSLAAGQIDSLAAFIDEIDFLNMRDRPRREEDPQDGSTYAITVRILSKGPPELADPAVHTVRCYEFSCERDFLGLKKRIVEVWGKEFVEAGV